MFSGVPEEINSVIENPLLCAIQVRYFQKIQIIRGEGGKKKRQFF